MGEKNFVFQIEVEIRFGKSRIERTWLQNAKNLAPFHPFAGK